MGDKFHTTRWSLIQAAGDSEAPGYREALARLCEGYWPAVYAFVRHSGRDAETAQDLTQGFFTQLLDNRSLKAARPERGRFRSFLLTGVKNFMANEWRAEQRQKRGGGVETLRLDFDAAEAMLGSASTDRATTETIFEKRWAVSVLRQAMQKLEVEMERSGKGDRFQRLKPLLTGEGTSTPYKELAPELGLSESVLKVAVHRLRQRFGKLLRREVSETLSDPALLDEEMAYLLDVLGA